MLCKLLLSRVLVWLSSNILFQTMKVAATALLVVDHGYDCHCDCRCACACDCDSDFDYDYECACDYSYHRSYDYGYEDGCAHDSDYI